MEMEEKSINTIEAYHSCVITEVRGEERLRFYDLGFFQGSHVLPLYECVGGGTRVYQVKDTLIALRSGDSKNIMAREG